MMTMRNLPQGVAPNIFRLGDASGTWMSRWKLGSMVRIDG